MRRIATGMLCYSTRSVIRSQIVYAGIRTFATQRKVPPVTEEQLVEEYEYMERSEDGIRIKVDPKGVTEFEVCS